MTAYAQARRSYASHAPMIRTPRSIEYDAVAHVTSRLRQATGKDLRSFAALAAALHDNRRLWTIFATEATNPRNPLPADLKAQLVYLAEFTDHHSRKVLAREADAGPLIEINMAIMTGLRGKGAS